MTTLLSQQSFLHFLTFATYLLNKCIKDWLSCLDNDDMATNLLLQLMHHVDRRSCMVLTAALCPTTHRQIVISSTHLLPDLRRLAALSLTTECQVHSRRLRLQVLLTKGCNSTSGRHSSSEMHDIWAQH